MLNWNIEERHFSPSQGYITGDVLYSLVERGWQISSMIPTTSGRAKLHECALERAGESINITVLDSPVVQHLLTEMGGIPVPSDIFYAHSASMMPA